jgi:hypothetical protein
MAGNEMGMQFVQKSARKSGSAKQPTLLFWTFTFMGMLCHVRQAHVELW